MRGKPEQSMMVSDRPFTIAKRWEREGINGLHIVDLDAALQTGSNAAIAESIIRHAKVTVQIGGGLRSAADVRGWVQKGVDRVVLGTLAYQDSQMLRRLLRAYGPERIVVATDYKDGRIVTKGWTKTEELKVVKAVKHFEGLGVETLLATAVKLDGTAQGPDITTLRTIRNSTNAHILASGGVRNEEDIRELQGIGVDGIVLGRALYEGTIRLGQLHPREA